MRRFKQTARMIEHDRWFRDQVRSTMDAIEADPEPLIDLSIKLCKFFVFAALFLFSVRYVHTYPSALTLEQQQLWIEIADKIGVADYELLYIGAMTAIDLIVAVILYALIMKFWRILYSSKV